MTLICRRGGPATYPVPPLCRTVAPFLAFWGTRPSLARTRTCDLPVTREQFHLI